MLQLSAAEWCCLKTVKLLALQKCFGIRHCLFTFLVCVVCFINCQLAKALTVCFTKLLTPMSLAAIQQRSTSGPKKVSFIQDFELLKCAMRQIQRTRIPRSIWWTMTWLHSGSQKPALIQRIYALIWIRLGNFYARLLVSYLNWSNVTTGENLT